MYTLHQIASDSPPTVMITDFHAKYFAYELTKRYAPDSAARLAGAVAGAQVDVNPHQVDAALFAFSSPLAKGALLADEVGLGKTIEAGLVISQRWAERKRRVLIITPSNLRKQWHQELSEKFFLPCAILETRSYNEAIRAGRFRPFTYLQQPEVQAAVLKEVRNQYRPPQMEMAGISKQPDLAAVVAKTTEIVVQQTIDIPRILVVPKGEVKSGFKPFTLNLSTINYPAPDDELWIRHLRTEQVDVIGLGRGSIDEQRLEDYVVSGLIDFDDVAYDEHADLLYDLAEQVVSHLRSYLSADDARKVLRLHQREIARFVHAQMQKHFWQDTDVDYDVVVTRGFTALRPSAYTAPAGEQPLDFRVSPSDKTYVEVPVRRFSSASSVQKFRRRRLKLTVLLEREALKWFKPAKGRFQIYCKWGADHGM
jgi:hypothetical protein